MFPPSLSSGPTGGNPVYHRTSLGSAGVLTPEPFGLNFWICSRVGMESGLQQNPSVCFGLGLMTTDGGSEFLRFCSASQGFRPVRMFIRTSLQPLVQFAQTVFNLKYVQHSGGSDASFMTQNQQEQENHTRNTAEHQSGSEPAPGLDPPWMELVVVLFVPEQQQNHLGPIQQSCSTFSLICCSW